MVRACAKMSVACMQIHTYFCVAKYPCHPAMCAYTHSWMTWVQCNPTIYRFFFLDTAAGGSWGQVGRTWNSSNCASHCHNQPVDIVYTLVHFTSWGYSTRRPKKSHISTYICTPGSLWATPGSLSEAEANYTHKHTPPDCVSSEICTGTGHTRRLI